MRGREAGHDLGVGRVGGEGQDVDVAVAARLPVRDRSDDVEPFDRSGRDPVVHLQPHGECVRDGVGQCPDGHGPIMPAPAAFGCSPLGRTSV